MTLITIIVFIDTIDYGIIEVCQLLDICFACFFNLESDYVSISKCKDEANGKPSKELERLR